MKKIILICNLVLFSSLLFAQSVEIKDSEATPNTLIQINDEGSAGSITIPEATTVNMQDSIHRSSLILQ